MAEPHPLASHHLPSFITAPQDTDVLMVIMSIILVAAVVGFGILFLRLHTLPERMAHKSKKIQFEIVAVLGLIALFTHMHIFWIAGLLLAFIDLPDFGGPLNRIASSAEKLAGVTPEDSQPDQASSPDAHEPTPQREQEAGHQHDDAAAPVKLVPVNRDLSHA